MQLYIKSIHIVFVVTWFAGLFYFPRLLVYDVESRTESGAVREALLSRFRIMQRRLLFGIMWPSMILTLIWGLWLAIGYFSISEPWILWKLGLVSLLVFYHLSLHKIYLDLKSGRKQWTSSFLRMWNEVPTVLLFAIVFLVVFKNQADMWFGVATIFILIAVLFTAIRVYKKYRSGKEQKK